MPSDQEEGFERRPRVATHCRLRDDDDDVLPAGINFLPCSNNQLVLHPDTLGAVIEFEVVCLETIPLSLSPPPPLSLSFGVFVCMYVSLPLAQTANAHTPH